MVVGAGRHLLARAAFTVYLSVVRSAVLTTTHSQTTVEDDGRSCRESWQRTAILQTEWTILQPESILTSTSSLALALVMGGGMEAKMILGSRLESLESLVMTGGMVQ